MMRCLLSAVVALFAFPAVAAEFGAIATSEQNAAFGYTYDMASEAEARAGAMSHCAKAGAGCKVDLVVSGECGAVSRGYAIKLTGNTYSHTAATGADKDTARNAALSACQGAGLRECEIVSWVCEKE